MVEQERKESHIKRQ